MFNRRNFLKSSGIVLVAATTRISFAKEKTVIKQFTTGNEKLDKVFYSDKEKILLRLVKNQYSHQFINFLHDNSNPSTYAIIEAENFDYNNLPQCKYIFVINDYFHSAVDQVQNNLNCPVTIYGPCNDVMTYTWNDSKYKYYWHKTIYSSYNKLTIYNPKTRKDEYIHTYTDTRTYE